jgi:hypothetical protein
MENIKINKNSLYNEILDFFYIIYESKNESNFKNENNSDKDLFPELINFIKINNLTFLSKNSFEKEIIPITFTIKIKEIYLPIFFNYYFIEYLNLNKNENDEIIVININSYFNNNISNDIFYEIINNFFYNILMLTYNENILQFFFVIIFIKKLFYNFIKYMKLKSSLLNNKYFTNIFNFFQTIKNYKPYNFLLNQHFLKKNSPNINFINDTIENLRQFLSYIDNFDTEYLIYLCKIKLKDKDIKKLNFYLKDNFFKENFNLLTNFSFKLNYNKNYFMILNSIIYDLIKREPIFKNSPKEIIDNIINKFESIYNDNKPINQKQNNFINYLSYLYNPLYFQKKEEIDNFIKKIKLNKLNLIFSNYFEESSFDINFHFKNKNDLNNFKKEINIFFENFDSIWNKINN